MSVPVQAAGRTPSITIRLDETIPRVLVSIVGPASGQLVADTLSQGYLAQPEITYLDMLFDLTAYSGAVESRHVEVIVDAYLRGNHHPLHPCRTAFVSPDPFFKHWAAAMSFQFTGREHRAFASFEAAERFLDEPMAERAPFSAA
ncbi:MAG: hypothetical protein KY446_06405 [Proteobacteria bacterium]|nr:hypothetical protein [Pseudomonadota bacterium]